MLDGSCGATIVHPCWENQEQPSRMLTDEWLGRVARAGLGVVAWHEERTHELEVLSRLPIFGICTNTPDVLAAIIHGGDDDAVDLAGHVSPAILRGEPTASARARA